MNGVNILNTEEILGAPCWAFDALAISVIACIVFVIGIVIIVSIADYVGVDLDFLCTIFLGLFTVSGILAIVFGIVNCFVGSHPDIISSSRKISFITSLISCITIVGSKLLVL